MENKKASLITIIVLLCIFAPLAILGLIFRDDKNFLEENPNHDFYYKGHLWFYNEKDELLSSYECQTEICELTTPTIDDGVYGINYFKNGTLKNVSKSYKYTFITDGAVIYLYDVVSGKSLQTYKNLKNYNTNVKNNAYIVQNSDELWGVLTVNDMLGVVLPFEYDFIGLVENSANEDEILNTEKFVVKKDNKWYIVDENNSAISSHFDDPIIDYNNDYIFTKNGEIVKIYSYQGFEYINNYTVKDYILEDKYIGIITNNYLLIYENLANRYIGNISIVGVTGKLSLEKVANKLNVKVNNEVIETVELS